MDRATFEHRHAAGRVRSRGQGQTRKREIAVVSFGVQLITALDPDGGIARPAEAHGARGDRIEHGPELARRPGNGAKDAGSRRLALERFLRLVEEAHVLDRDRGLIRECLDERDLAIAERSRSHTAKDHHPDLLIVAKQRHTQDGSASLGRGLQRGLVRRIREHVGNLDRLP